MADPDPNKPTVTMTEDQLKKLLKENNQNRTPPASARGFDMQQAVTIATGGLSSMRKLIDETADVWRASSDIGIGFNNDSVGLRTSIAKTRLGTDEYTDVIGRAKLGLTSLGGSMTEGAKAFNRLSDDFSRSEAADRLTKLGYSTKEFNEVLALSVTGKRFDTANDQQSSYKARQAAEELAVEMDKVAQLTGVSRRDQMEALQAQQRDARLQAAFEIEIRKGGTQVADDYKKASANLQGVGLDKLGKELFTGQALSEKAIAQMNALGPAGTQLREAMNATRDARTKEQRDAAGMLMQNAQAAVATRIQQDSYLALVVKGQGVVADAAGEQYIAAKNYAESLNAVRREALDSGKTLTDQEAAEAAAKRVDLAQRGKDKDGKDVEGAKTTELAIQAQNRLKDAYVVSAQIIEASNNSLGRGPTVDALIEKTRNVKMQDGVKSSFVDRFGANSLQELVKSINNDTPGGDLPGLIKQGFKEAAEATLDIGKIVGGGILDSVVPGFKSFFENIKEMFPNLKDIKEAVKRDTGTLGKTGQLREPTDIFASVEAGETVFTPTQLDNFARNVAESAKTQMPPEFTSVLRSMQVNQGTSGTSSGIDLFADMFKNIQTSISSANAPSKNPADQSSIMFSDQVIEQNARIAEAISKFSTADTATKDTVPSVDFASVFDGLFKGLQTEIPKFGETVRTSFSNLASVIPSAQQNRTSEMSRTIPAEISQARIETQRQEENRKREAAQQNTTTDNNNQRPNETALAGTATLDDLKDLLEQLNSTMGLNVSHLSDLVNSTDKQVRATKRLDPNVTMRS
jgi:hypothetical protein